jgi:ectoine hydroxylase-related dioxygenase (phytanoyl-CoA dioxygenase family)
LEIIARSAGVQIYTHEALIFTPYLIHGLAFNQNDRKTRMALELRFNVEQDKPRR